MVWGASDHARRLIRRAGPDVVDVDRPLRLVGHVDVLGKHGGQERLLGDDCVQAEVPERGPCHSLLEARAFDDCPGAARIGADHLQLGHGIARERQGERNRLQERQPVRFERDHGRAQLVVSREFGVSREQHADRKCRLLRQCTRRDDQLHARGRQGIARGSDAERVPFATCAAAVFGRAHARGSARSTVIARAAVIACIFAASARSSASGGARMCPGTASMSSTSHGMFGAATARGPDEHKCEDR